MYEHKYITCYFYKYKNNSEQSLQDYIWRNEWLFDAVSTRCTSMWTISIITEHGIQCRY